MKVCSKCKISKSLDSFTRRKTYADGLESRCRACKNETKRAWAAHNKLHIKTYNKATRYKYPYSIATHRLRTYGITEADYASMLETQGYKCFLCEESLDKTGRVCIDHDYETNKVRKILCIKCNTGLGMFNESAEALRRAANYLDNHRQEGDKDHGTV